MIERMNERILIQVSGVSTDVYGNHNKTWTDYFRCWTYASTYNQDEKADVVTTDQRGTTFEVRFCSELKDITSDQFRVVFRGEIYDIQSVDMMNWMKKTIKLKCRKVDRS